MRNDREPDKFERLKVIADIQATYIKQLRIAIKGLLDAGYMAGNSFDPGWIAAAKFANETLEEHQEK